MKLQTILFEDMQALVCFFISDGSVCNGPVGYGACAAVLFPNVNNGDTQIVKKPIGNLVCSEKCEMEGVILGLEMSAEYLRGTVSTVTNQKLFLFCDCATVIDKFHLFELHMYPDILHRLHTVLCPLHELQVSVNMVKIPGHISIIGNSIAGLKAKETLHMLLFGNISVPDNITFSNACKISADIAAKS